MKVLLIAPYINYKDGEDFYPSAALLYLAGVLRANKHEPIMVDLNNVVVHRKKEKYFDYSKKIIIDNLKEHKPDLVGINCMFASVFPDLLEFAKIIKTHSPNTKIAIGGIHPTCFPKEILSNCKDIDYVAIAEGEKAMIALADLVEAKQTNALGSIKSFAYRDKDGIVKINRKVNYVDDLDSLPMPAWDLINFKDFEIDLNHYYNPKKLPINHKVAIFTSRACPLACNFCDMFLIMGKKHRKRSPKTIVDEIELLNKSYGINYFSFNDDQLTLNKAHIIDVCNEILKRKLNIAFDTPNGLWINSLKEEIIAKMAEAGLVKACLAIEHGDDHMRNKVIGKVLDRKKIFEVAEMIKKHKLMSVAWFIMGFPEDTNETLENTYKMINELQVDFSAVGILMPFPGTSLFKQVVNDKLFIHDWNLDTLWKSPINYQLNFGKNIGNATGDFVIKPYNMSVDDLYKWRDKFESIKVKYWKTNPKQPVVTI